MKVNLTLMFRQLRKVLSQLHCLSFQDMTLDSQDKVFLGTTFATAVVGAALIITGFVLRFGRGFGTFADYARKVRRSIMLYSFIEVFVPTASCVVKKAFHWHYVNLYLH
ncbi:hypothetical protein ANCCAN_27924 [Ancylostoma caninum]|uniref:Uncharacterized protein n=1 Tax=Ancylostoma caninum TaxID=29170 RepID=A0A368F5T6_ANCCA|nr:hypothetical protein ANCCAN_27924 [Ancylostoma caninum]